MNRMVIAPHADDETMGCGGLLAKYPDTAVLVVCDLDEDRLNEFENAMVALAVMQYECGGLPDGHAGDYPAQLVTLLDHWLGVFKPHELYIPAPGTHQDHVSVYEGAMRAARMSMNKEHWSPATVLVYDVPAYDLELYPTNLRWNMFESLDPVHVQRKANAMACYGSQVPSEEHPGSNGSVFAAARMAGSEVGVLFAEKFSAIRMVRS